MQILILGGTAFLGRAITTRALEQGHDVTLFHRGQTNPELFPEAEHILGDRHTDLELLQNRSWDAVVDVFAQCSPEVRQIATALVDHVQHYTLISTISVFADHATQNVDETYPRATMEGINEDRSDMATYGARKARCEDTIHAVFGPNRSLIIRPGMIIGPHDYTRRFTYWAERFQRPGPVLAPQPAEQPIQVIDVRDLANWIISMVEVGQTGVFNATGPEQPITMSQMLEACRNATSSSNEIHWLPETYLLENDVAPFSDLPFWLAENPDYQGIFTVNVEKAIQAGLSFRPLETTIRDLLEAENSSSSPPRPSGIQAEREQNLLTHYLNQA